jgi:hypothetical protein
MAKNSKQNMIDLGTAAVKNALYFDFYPSRIVLEGFDKTITEFNFTSVSGKIKLIGILNNTGAEVWPKRSVNRRLTALGGAVIEAAIIKNACQLNSAFDDVASSVKCVAVLNMLKKNASRDISVSQEAKTLWMFYSQHYYVDYETPEIMDIFKIESDAASLSFAYTICDNILIPSSAGRRVLDAFNGKIENLI